MSSAPSTSAAAFAPRVYIGDVYPSLYGKHVTVSYRVPGTDWYIPFIYRRGYAGDPHNTRYSCAQCLQVKKNKGGERIGSIPRFKVTVLSQTIATFDKDPSTPELHCCGYWNLAKCSYALTIEAKRAQRKKKPSPKKADTVPKRQKGEARGPYIIKKKRPGHDEYVRRKAKKLYMEMHSTLPDLLIAFKYDTYLFDADGVLWRSNEPVPGAIRFIDELLEKGKKVFIVTNNSTKSTAAYMEKVKQLGFGHLSEENIISPNVVMVDYFKRHPQFMSRGVYTIGSAGVIEMLEKELGAQTFGAGPDPVPGDATFLESVDMAREASAVVVGFDVHISYTKIMKAANYLRDPNCGFFITNEDFTFPGLDKNKTIPGTGCITAAIRAAAQTRQPTVFGKPSEQLERYMKAHFDLNPASTIMFGDRLDTDIKFGNQLGVDTCWMRTGVHTAADVERAKAGEDAQLVPKYTFDFEEFYAKPTSP